MVVLFEDALVRVQLFPFTHTRSIADIKIGIFTIAEKWQRLTGETIYCKTEPLVEALRLEQNLQPTTPYENALNNALYINASLVPDLALVEQITNLSEGSILQKDGKILAHRGALADCTEHYEVEPKFKFTLIERPWDIFTHTGAGIRFDFGLLNQAENVGTIDEYTTVIGDGSYLFIEAGAKITAATINASTGPVYIGKNAEVQEGALIRGPLALLEGAVVNMGAKLRGDNSIGRFCKVGGEISNSVFFDFSNKGHDGFIGNSVIGSWCNLGADTNCSNLKNNYSPVQVYSWAESRQVNTGLQFCGLLMGDHCKAGINTMFNTGTITGVGANIWGGGFQNKLIEDFAWGPDGDRYDFLKFIAQESRVMARRGLQPSESLIALLRNLFYNGEQN